MVKIHKRFSSVKLKDGQRYVFDKYIFRGVIIIALLIFATAWILSGTFLMNKNLHIICKSNNVCSNPVFEHPESFRGYNIPSYLYEMEYLPAGFEINKPNWLITNFGLLFLFDVIIGFLVNHSLHNKGFRLKRFLREE